MTRQIFQHDSLLVNLFLIVRYNDVGAMIIGFRSFAILYLSHLGESSLTTYPTLVCNLFPDPSHHRISRSWWFGYVTFPRLYYGFQDNKQRSLTPMTWTSIHLGLVSLSSFLWEWKKESLEMWVVRRNLLCISNPLHLPYRSIRSTKHCLIMKSPIPNEMKNCQMGNAPGRRRSLES